MAQESLKEATLSGARWLTLTRAVGEILALIAVVALARLLTPAEFGRAAVALILVPLAVILTFEGFASALVQRPSVDETHRRAGVLMSLVGGSLLSAIVIVLVPLVWRPLFGADTAGLIALMAPVFLIAATGGVSRAMLWRRLDFRRISLIDLCSMVVGNALAVTLAVLGLGAKAIVIGALAQTAADSLLLFLAAPAPLPRWHRRAQREIGGFGLPAALAGLVNTLFRNVDYAILAVQLPAARTGIYYRAFNLGVAYQDKLSGVMMQLAFPVYSRTESHDELRRMHERATRVLAAVVFPLLTSFIVLAPVLVPFVFGAAWEPSVRPAQILALAGMMSAILTGYPQVMLAIGRPRALLHFNLVMLAVYAGAVAITASHGLIAVSVAVVIVYAGILAGVYRFLLQRYVGISIARLIPELGPAVAGCLALAAVTEPLRHLLEAAAPRALTIGVVGTVGLIAYTLVLRAVFPSAWSDLRLLVVRVLPPLARLGGPRPAAVSPSPPVPAPSRSGVA